MGEKVATGVVSPETGRAQVKDEDTGQVSYVEKGSEVEQEALERASVGTREAVKQEAHSPGAARRIAEPIDKPTIAPPPTPPPAPEVGTTAKVEIPKGAVERKDTNIFEHKGEVYFKPGSTTYEMGFRTGTELAEAQKAGVTYGIHEGKRVPASSFILEGVRGLYRGRFPNIRYSGEDPATTALSQSVVTRVQKKKYKVPVTAISEKGETVQLLLPPKVAEKVSKLKGEAQFNALQKLGVYPGDWTYETRGKEVRIVTGPEVEARAKAVGAIAKAKEIFAKKIAEVSKTHTEVDKGIWISKEEIIAIKRDTPKLHEVLVSQGYDKYIVAADKHNQEVKMHNQQLKEDLGVLSDYQVPGVKDEYHIANAINAGVSPVIIKRVFGDASYKEGVVSATELKEYQEYQAATPEGKFGILVAEGTIPKGSKFDSQDKEGNILYTPPYPGAGVAPEVLEKLEVEFKTVSRRSRGTIIGIALRGTSRVPEPVEIKNIYRSLNQKEKTKVLSYFADKYKRDNTEVALKKAFPSTSEQNVIIRMALGLMPPPAPSRWDRLNAEQKERVLSYYSTLEPIKVLGVTIPKEAVPGYKEAIKGVKIMLAPIPLLGTAVWWKDLSGIERGVSIALDALIVTSIAKPGLIMRILKTSLKSPEVVKAASSYRQSLGASIRALRKVDKNLVSPFKKMAKAQVIYADNLAEVRDLERTLARGIGEVAPGVRESLSTKRAQLPKMWNNLVRLGDEFAEAQAKASRAAYDDIPLRVTRFGDDIAKETKHAVDLAFDEIKSAPVIERKIGKLIKIQRGAKQDAVIASRLFEDLNSQWKLAGQPSKGALVNSLNQQALIFRAAGKRSSEIALKLSRLQSELLISKSGAARKIADKLVEIKEKIQKAKDLWAESRDTLQRLRQKSKTTPGIDDLVRNEAATLKLLEQEVRKLVKIEQGLQKEAKLAFNAMESQWALPLTPGGGNVITRTVPTVAPRFAGGGIQAPQGVAPFISAVGVKGPKAIIAGEESVTPEPLVSEPEFPDIVITEPHLTVAVPESPTLPKVAPKVWPIHPEIPEPFHRGVTFIDMPRVAPITRQQVDTLIKPYLKTASEVRAKQVIRDMAALGYKPSAIKKALANVKASVKAAEATKPISETKPSTVTSEAVKIKTDYKTVIQPSSATFIKAKPITKPAVVLKPKPAIKIPVKPAIKEPKKPLKLKPIPVPFSGGMSDEEKKEVIAKSLGVVAWYQGKLSDDTIIHVVKHPWRGKESHATLKGKIPPGFKLVTGPGSAADTAVLLYGEAPASKFMVDIGIVDANIDPAGRGIKLTFSADPKQLTTGSITLGKRTPQISPPIPPLERRRKMKMPKVPSIR